MKLLRQPPGDEGRVLRLIENKWDAFKAVLPVLPDGRYLHWDELRHRPAPDGLSSEEWWLAMRWARREASVPVTAMQACYAVPFSFAPLPKVQSELFSLDRTNVGRDLLGALGDHDLITEYRVSQLIEEAISSSVIEGARPTTRELARQMLTEGRTPTSRDERMILNNWRAMRRILELRDHGQPLTLDDLLELHRILGDDALEVPGAEGQLRTREHSVVVSDIEGNVWHTPPDAEGLPERMQALLRFANDTSQDPLAFIHPIVRAILVHFWIGYEHPFRDGNGRIARALFYWCMLRHGYEMAEFLSISGPIDRSPKAYYLAFAQTETDDGDLTYFVLHQLDVIRLALRDLTEHVNERVQRKRLLAARVADLDDLNHRQRALLQHAVRYPMESYTIEGHARSHQVHYQTARTDLLNLVKRGLLEAWRATEGKRFRPTAKLAKPKVT